MTYDPARSEAGSPVPEDPPVYRIRLAKVTSFLIVTHRETVAFTGTLGELHHRYRKVLFHNLAFGWWGIPFGIIWTPFALLTNRDALHELDRFTGS